MPLQTGLLVADPCLSRAAVGQRSCPDAFSKLSAHTCAAGMVALLQQVLQLYAAKVLVTPDAEGIDEVLNQIIAAPEAEWTDIIKQRAAGGQLQLEPVLAVLQKRMEGVVLGQSSGSYAQRVQVRQSVSSDLELQMFQFPC